MNARECEILYFIHHVDFWSVKKQKKGIPFFCVLQTRKSNIPSLMYVSLWRCDFYPKNEINTPAATAEPMTPEILEAMQ